MLMKYNYRKVFLKKYGEEKNTNNTRNKLRVFCIKQKKKDSWHAYSKRSIDAFYSP